MLKQLFATVIAGSVLTASALAGPNEGVQAAEAKTADSLGAATLWAVVRADGTIARQNGVNIAASGKVDCNSGCYNIVFRRNVRQCNYVATIGESNNAGVATQGTISTNGRFNNLNGVFVLTQDLTGGFADRPFHLLVTCAG